MFGFVRALIKLALVALVVHAGVKIVPVFWNYVRFRDACEEIAKFSSKKAEAEIKSRVLAKASQFEIPVSDDTVQVRKQGPATFITADYTGQLRVLPDAVLPVRLRGQGAGHAARVR